MHAVEVLSTMVEHQAQKDAITYSAAISACEKGNEWEKALVLFASIHQAKLQIGTTVSSATISACGKGSEWVRAIQLLGTMAQDRIAMNTVAYE